MDSDTTLPKEVSGEREGSKYIRPTQIIRTKEDWKELLSLAFEEFDGNIDNAASLMSSLVRGIDYVHNKLATEGIEKFQRPEVVILFDESKLKGNIACIEDGKIIFVKKSFLERSSRYDPAQNPIATSKTKLGEVAIEGTPDTLFFFAGVEEAGQADFEQNPPATTLIPYTFGNSDIQVPMEQYDATDEEYRGLEWQVRAAKDESNHVAPKTISILENRLKAANTFRSTYTMPTTLQGIASIGTPPAK